jgi:predicted DNA-binding transcriptional regulator AlpA
MGAEKIATHTAAGLPKLVGYRELHDAWGFSRKQLERMQADGRFPRAMHITGAGGNRRAWELQQVLDWLEAQRVRVTNLAVTDPSKLKPEELDTALANTVAELARRKGFDVPDGSVMAVHTPLTAEQLAAIHERAARALADAFARLDPVRAWLVVGGLIPALRQVADRFLENMTGAKPSETQDGLRALAIDILDQAIGGEFVGPAAF